MREKRREREGCSAVCVEGAGALTSQGMQMASRSRKGKETDFSPEPPEEYSFVNILLLAQ